MNRKQALKCKRRRRKTPAILWKPIVVGNMRTWKARKATLNKASLWAMAYGIADQAYLAHAKRKDITKALKVIVSGLRNPMTPECVARAMVDFGTTIATDKPLGRRIKAYISKHSTPEVYADGQVIASLHGLKTTNHWSSITGYFRNLPEPLYVATP